MTAINQGRVWLGALVGGIVWWLWSAVVNLGVLGTPYAEAQKNGQLLAQPRYTLFTLYWLVTLILLSAVIARLYGHLRQTMGPGPRTALMIGLAVGFAAGFPMSLSMATWGTFPRILPLWWCLDLWAGACISAILSGWLYKDPKLA
jgi:hypothetical protein